MARLQRFLALGALSLVAPTVLLAQSTRLDPALSRRLDAPATRPSGVLDGLAAAPSALLEAPMGLVVHTRDVAALRRAGLTVEAVFDGMAVVRATRAELPALLAAPGVTRVALGEDELPHNDMAGALVGAKALHDGLLGNQAYRGAGAIVCVFDTGIDFRHLDFRSTADTTKSRILRLYDMTLTPTGAEMRPQGLPTTYTTGVEYTQAQLNDELDGTPTGFVRSRDTNGHGTHVMGTAASNGGSMTPRQFVGMAPDADLVVVRGGVSSFSNANILNGIKYCGEVATAVNKPMVMNMSLGSDSGPHDGQDSKSAAIAQLVQSANGRVVVQSGGNSGASLIHRGGTLAPGDSVELVFNVAAAGTAADPGFGVDIWTKGRNLTLIAVTPNGTRLVRTAGGAQTDSTGQGRPYLYNYLINGTGRWDGDLDRELYFVSHNSADTVRTAAGTWRLRIRNDDTVADEWHGWLFDATSGGGAVTFVGADARYTVSNASPEAIAAGSYVSRWVWNSVAGNYGYSGTNRQDLRSSFSSQGPSRDGRPMPDISAPGQAILSARSRHAAPGTSDQLPDGKHVKNQGTSMAAPVVTGSVALLLGANPALRYDEVKALLRDNATVDAAVLSAGPVPNNEFGAGKLNVYQAMSRMVSPNSTATQRVVQYDASGVSSTGVTLPAGSNLVVRLQTPIVGKVRSVLFHTSAAQPSGGYDVRLWDDNGGVPGAQLGATVNLPAAAIRVFGWNVVGTDAFGATLVPGRDYFVSVTPVGSDGSFRHDGATAEGRTYLAPEAAPAGAASAQALGTLAVQAYDALVRAVVTSDEAAILPVELVTFEGALSSRRAVLTWTTASERNNAGFAIEKRSGGADEWVELGFVRGAGTTTETKGYRFETGALGHGTHTFRLRQMDTDGTAHYSGVVSVEVAVERVLALDPAGPNPFSAQTAFTFTVPADGPARVEMFDLLGRRVRTLFDGAAVAGKAERLELSADALGAGVYLVRATHGGRTVQQRVTVVR